MASGTRIADQLAGHGVDAACGRSFDDYDHATEISFEWEKWSNTKGHNSFTAAYTAPGGPDVWWSVHAAHTITRVRVLPGMTPQSTVLLTTPEKLKRPHGFSRLSGGQRAALQGQTLVPDRHYQLPIGSAGVLVGETANQYPVYLPLDDIDTSINFGDARAFMQFAVRATAAGGIVTLGPRFTDFTGMIGAQIGPESKVAWPHATTYLGGTAKLLRPVRDPRRFRPPIGRRPPSPPVISRFAKPCASIFGKRRRFAPKFRRNRIKRRKDSSSREL